MNTTILTIDDDPAITDLLSVILRANGFDMLIANSGEDGVRICKRKIAPSCDPGFNDAGYGRLAGLQSRSRLYERSDPDPFSIGRSICGRQHSRRWRR